MQKGNLLCFPGFVRAARLQNKAAPEKKKKVDTKTGLKNSKTDPKNDPKRDRKI